MLTSVGTEVAILQRNIRVLSEPVEKPKDRIHIKETRTMGGMSWAKILKIKRKINQPANLR